MEFVQAARRGPRVYTLKGDSAPRPEAEKRVSRLFGRCQDWRPRTRKVSRFHSIDQEKQIAAAIRTLSQ